MLSQETDGHMLAIPQRNIILILINGIDELLSKEELTDLEDLRDITIAFLDSGGATEGESDYCNYCQEIRDIKSSDNTDKAISSLLSHRETSYGAYLTVQNELVAA